MRTYTVLALVLLGLLGSGCRRPYGIDSISHEQWVIQAQRNALGTSDVSDLTALAVNQRGLAELQARQPDDVIARMHEDLLQDHSRTTAAALAELCYLRAKGMNAHSPEATHLYLTAALLGWAYMFDPDLEPNVSPYDERFTLARSIYNHAVSRVILNLREAGTPWGTSTRQNTVLGAVQLDYGRNELSWNTGDQGFHDVITAYEINVRGLSDHPRSSGLGAPLVLVRRTPEASQATPQDKFFHPSSDLALPATALLTVEGSVLAASASGETLRVVLEVFDPLRNQEVTINSESIPLEADTTAALAYKLEHARLPTGLTGLLDATAWEKDRGLYMLMPYQEDKIPVVFVHGLMSSPLTWLPMINNLLGDEEFRRHYQIWYFLYPTADPILYNAAALRASLMAAQKTFDPNLNAPAFSNMVLVAHSMGGLLSRLNVIDSGDKIWSSLFAAPFEEVEMSDKQRHTLSQFLFFEPVPFPKRVVFIATPHRGSQLADLWLSRQAGDRVKLSEGLESTESNMKKFMRPELVAEVGKKGGSVDSLSEHNPVLGAMDTIPFPEYLRYHSIIADETAAGHEGGSDSIVPYKSSHLDGAESELIIHGVHTCTGRPEVIREVRRILRLHALQVD